MSKSNNFQTIFSSLELALEKATDYARAYGEDVFITYIRYGRPEAPQYEFRYRLRSEVKGEPLNICYLCTPSGEKTQINMPPCEAMKNE